MAKKQQPTAVDLSDIDYTKLDGESLQKYLKIAGVHAEVQPQLGLMDYYKFELYQAYPEFKYKLDEDTGDKIKYLFAIRLRRDKPINTTSIMVKDAMLMNKGIDGANALDQNSKFYLLQKAQFETVKSEA